MRHVDLTGETFGMLKVLRKDVSRKTWYICECQCKDKNIISIQRSHLVSGSTKSCGFCKQPRKYTTKKSEEYLKKAVAYKDAGHTFKELQENYDVSRTVYHTFKKKMQSAPQVRKPKTKNDIWTNLHSRKPWRKIRTQH